MADVQFSEEQEFSRPAAAPQQSALVRLALATGLVKTERGAEYLLLGFAGVCIVIALFVVFSGGSGYSATQLFREGQNVLLPAGTPPPPF